jgi:hypothetical protein|tara:strand:- start:24060 stop:24935 length:876 start_codon:yes stop_codon:yes gene_type:complete
MNGSINHHVIPEFFIKGFCGSDNKVSLYYTDRKKLEKVRRSPSQIFYDKHRNTHIINGKKTQIIETIYGVQENIFSKAYERIINNEFPNNIPYSDYIQLIYFLEELHWRVPSQDIKAKKILNELSFEDLGLFSRDSINNDDVYKKIKNDNAFIEIAKILKSDQNYNLYDSRKNINDWLISYLPINEQGYNVLGDNPIILENKNAKNILDSNFVVNLSKDKAIYKFSNKPKRKLTKKDQLNLDLLTFLQAKKMVCCSNSDYLKDVVDCARSFYNTDEKIEILREEIFTLFKK